MKQQTVYVVDDDDGVRNSLGFLLRSVDLNVELFASAQEFLDERGKEEVGCLVLDVRMPGISGLELQQELKSMGSSLPIIFITGHGDIPMAVEALKAGATDFLPKPFRDQELLDRIHQALDINREREHLAQEVREIEAQIDSLTPRESEVMGMVASGNANKVIAIDLGISQRTVEIHRAKVMEKMGVRALADLVRMLHEAGYFKGEPE
jgi:two-component system response regulator FixJ